MLGINRRRAEDDDQYRDDDQYPIPAAAEEPAAPDQNAIEEDAAEVRAEVERGAAATAIADVDAVITQDYGKAMVLATLAQAHATLALSHEVHAARMAARSLFELLAGMGFTEGGDGIADVLASGE